MTHETNISISESSAEPRIARDPDAKPMIALSRASMIDITRANRIPKEGVTGSLNIRLYLIFFSQEGKKYYAEKLYFDNLYIF